MLKMFLLIPKNRDLSLHSVQALASQTEDNSNVLRHSMVTRILITILIGQVVMNKWIIF